MRIRISLCGGDNWEEEIKGDRILLESSEVESEENKILKTETLSVGEQPTDKGVCVCVSVRMLFMNEMKDLPSQDE